MRKIIDGKTYETATATELAFCDLEEGAGLHLTLFQNQDGDHFYLVHFCDGSGRNEEILPPMVEEEPYPYDFPIDGLVGFETIETTFVSYEGKMLNPAYFEENYA